jgi:hypothetical protein
MTDDEQTHDAISSLIAAAVGHSSVTIQLSHYTAACVQSQQQFNSKIAAVQNFMVLLYALM